MTNNNLLGPQDSTNLQVINPNSKKLIDSLFARHSIKYNLQNGFEDTALSSFPSSSLVQLVKQVHEKTFSDYQQGKNTRSREFLYYAVELRYYMVNKFANGLKQDVVIEGVPVILIFQELGTYISNYITQGIGAKINPENVNDWLRAQIGYLVTLIESKNKEIKHNQHQDIGNRKDLARRACDYSQFIPACRKKRTFLSEGNDVFQEGSGKIKPR